MKTPTPASPLGRSVERDVLDWDSVEAQREPRAVDVFGFRPEDRQILGMSPPRTLDLAPEMEGDASAALVEALARGAAVQKARRDAQRRSSR